MAPARPEAHDPPHVVAEGDRVLDDRVCDRLVEQVGDLHLEDEPDEGEHQRGDEDPLVGLHDGHGPPQPGLRAVGVDGGPGCAVAVATRPPARTGDGLRLVGRRGAVLTGVLLPPGRGGQAGPPATGPGRRRPAWPSPRRGGSAAMPTSRPSTASSAAARRCRPEGVSRWDTRRRSSSPWRRSTRPRPTSPSTTAVTLGGRTASRSARADEISGPASSRQRTRYWGSERPTSSRPSSTCLAIHAAVRPTWWTAGRPAVSGAGRAIYLGYRTIRLPGPALKAPRAARGSAGRWPTAGCGSRPSGTAWPPPARPAPR